jgi:hypothetical protein
MMSAFSNVTGFERTTKVCENERVLAGLGIE